MTRIYMVRHGKAVASFGESADPGLHALGREQAEGAARTLAKLAPVKLITSPLKRARETSLPLAALWKRDAIVENAVAEIPSPHGLGLAQRAEWLREFMQGSWRGAPPDLATWREACVAALVGQKEDVVVFSHFIAINVAAGAAEHDERVILFPPDNCSITIFETDGTRLHLRERGAEADTKVN
jgi:broad specificity phosphatase PhoE